MPTSPLTPRQVRWVRGWVIVVLIGLGIFTIGVNPDLIGQDRSPVIGFVQVGVWLTGLGILLVGAYAAVRVVRNSRPNSLRADIGLRLIATGYVVAAAASLADFIGIGSHHLPWIYFGPIQVMGLGMGAVTSLVGIILYWPRKTTPPPSKEDPGA
jgi:hypothetical protein